MNVIKFSHDYLKFGDYKLPFRALLLDAWVVNRNDLHGQFVVYDTAYFDHTAPKGVNYYELPKGDVIILFFAVRNGLNLMENFKFTTIRRYTPLKYEYYKKQCGTIFDMVRT